MAEVKLRKPQIRILEVLKKSGNKPLTRKQIAEKSKTLPEFYTTYIGSPDPMIMRARGDQKDYGYPSLIFLGLAKSWYDDVKGRDVIVTTITAKGRKFLERLKT